MVNVKIQQTILLVVLAVAFCKLAASSLVVQEAGLRVLFPVVRDLNMSMADFGMPKYGAFLKYAGVLLSTAAVLHLFFRRWADSFCRISFCAGANSCIYHQAIATIGTKHTCVPQGNASTLVTTT